MRLIDLAASYGGKLIPLVLPTDVANSRVLLNPSITAFHNDQYLVSIRATNFILKPELSKHLRVHKQELVTGKDDYFTSESLALVIDSSFNHLQSSKIEVSQINPQWIFQGLEDVRLISWGGEIYASGTRRDFKRDGEGRIEISRLVFDDLEGCWKESAKSIPKLRGQRFSYLEKNWAPVAGKPFTFVRWSWPTEVVVVNDWQSGESEIIHKQSSSDLASLELRGGSQLIPWEGGYISFAHQSNVISSYLGVSRVEYSHRVLLWNREIELIKVSSIPFSIMGGEVEFVSGATRHKDGILLSFGFQDSCAFLLELSKKAIEELIEYSKS